MSFNYASKHLVLGSFNAFFSDWFYVLFLFNYFKYGMIQLWNRKKIAFKSSLLIEKKIRYLLDEKQTNKNTRSNPTQIIRYNFEMITILLYDLLGFAYRFFFLNLYRIEI